MAAVAAVSQASTRNLASALPQGVGARRMPSQSALQRASSGDEQRTRPASRVAPEPAAGPGAAGQHKPPAAAAAAGPVMDFAHVRRSITEVERRRAQRAAFMSEAQLQARRNKVGAFIGVVNEVMEQRRERRSLAKSRLVLHPASALRKNWDLLSMVLLVYTAVFTPFQIAFLADEMEMDDIGAWPAVFALDRLVDFVFLVDLALNFRTAWVTPEGSVEFEWREAARHYLRGWFWIDLVSILPYDFISLLPGMDVENSAALRMPKLLRLFRLVKIAKVLRASRIFKRWEQSITIRYGWLRLIKFGVVILLMSHWMATGLYLVSTLADEGDTTWATLEGLDGKSVGEKYISSAYWAVMTLTTIGYGDIVATSTAERLYMIMAMLLGAGMFAYVVGTCCSLVQNLSAKTLAFQMHMDAVNEYMDSYSFPDHLKKRIRRYCFYWRDSGHAHHDNSLLYFCSPALRNEAALFTYQATLEQVPQFKGAPPGFLSALAQAMRPAIFSPNELIMEQGEPGDCMFIIGKGRAQVELRAADGGVRVVAIKRAGSHMGERSALFGSVRSATVRALSYVECYVISKDDLDSILPEFPQVRERIRVGLVRNMWWAVVRGGRWRDLAARRKREQLVVSDAGSDADDASSVGSAAAAALPSALDGIDGRLLDSFRSTGSGGSGGGGALQELDTALQEMQASGDSEPVSPARLVHQESLLKPRAPPTVEALLGDLLAEQRQQRQMLRAQQAVLATLAKQVRSQAAHTPRIPHRRASGPSRARRGVVPGVLP